MRKNKVQVITVGQYPESKNFIILLQRREKAEHFFFLNQSKWKQKQKEKAHPATGGGPAGDLCRRLRRCGGALLSQPAAGHRLFAFVAGKGHRRADRHRFCASALLPAFCRRALYLSLIHI